MIVLNLIVLLFEVLYYSCFMYFAKRDGKFWKYLVLFGIITLSGLFIKTNTFISYLYLVLAILYGMKYIVKVKTTLYDMLVVLIMLFISFLIQYPFYLIGVNFEVRYEITFIYEPLKLLLVIIARDYIRKMYIKLKKKWDNNNFYIRYIFSCLSYIYVIITIIFLILH